MLFEFGKQVYDILKDTLQPDPELGIEPIDYTDLDSGANFRVLVKKDGPFPSWTKSKFMAPSNIDDDLDKLNIDDDFIFDNIYDLDVMVTSKKFNDYDVIKTRWNKYLKTVNMSNLELDSKVEKEEEKALETYSRKSREIDEKKETSIRTPRNARNARKEQEESEEKEASTRKSRKSRSESKGETKLEKKMSNYFEEYED